MSPEPNCIICKMTVLSGLASLIQIYFDLGWTSVQSLTVSLSTKGCVIGTAGGDVQSYHNQSVIG